MKKDKLLNLFNEFDFKKFIKNNMSCYKIRKAISQNIGEDPCPSTTAIVSYIQKEFNLQWDTKTHSWITYKITLNTPLISKKKIPPKNNNTFTINHENKLYDEIPIDNSPKTKSNQLSLDLKITKPNITEENSKNNNNDDLKEENHATFKNSYEPNFEENLHTNNNLNENVSKMNIKNINFDLSQCYEYIVASENKKISISINCMLLELIEKLMCEKYNIKPKGNRSKIIHLALIECLKNNSSNSSL